MLFLSLVLPRESLAQRENAIWYFGANAGLDFNKGEPILLHNSKMNTRESGSSISDSAGNLLFYTDGNTVWNSKHQVMEGGEDFGLVKFSAQSAMIVKQPSSTSKYYIFTSDSIHDDAKLSYHLVDMSQNGGLGKVTLSKQVLLIGSAEKLTGIVSADKTFAWILGQKINSPDIYAWKLTETGISTPVISAVSLGMYNKSDENQTGGGAWMRTSPNGKWIASGVRFALSDQQPYIEIFRFDTVNGKLEPLTQISSIFTGGAYPYGLAFSSNSNFLYVGANRNLWQFSMESNTSAGILASGQKVASWTRDIQSLQNAIDGKIYISHWLRDKLSTIHNPNSEGITCNAEQFHLSLEGKINKESLPNFVVRSSDKSAAFRFENYCPNSPVNFFTEATGATNYEWNFGDSQSANNTSTDKDTQHTYASAGLYWVSLKGFKDNVVVFEDLRSIRIYAPPAFSIEQTATLCKDGVTELKFSEPKKEGVYEWFDGSNEETVRINAAGNYWCNYTAPDNVCTATSTVFVAEKRTPLFTISTSSTCFGSAIQLNIERDADRYIWQANTPTMHEGLEYTATTTGTYTVLGENECGTHEASKEIEVQYCGQVEIPNVVKTATPDASFRIKSWEGATWHLQVLNRWGKLRYNNDNFQNNWNDFDLQPGVYFYILHNKTTNETHKSFFHVL